MKNFTDKEIELARDCYKKWNAGDSTTILELAAATKIFLRTASVLFRLGPEFRLAAAELQRKGLDMQTALDFRRRK